MIEKDLKKKDEEIKKLKEELEEEKLEGEKLKLINHDSDSQIRSLEDQFNRDIENKNNRISSLEREIILLKKLNDKNHERNEDDEIAENEGEVIS